MCASRSRIRTKGRRATTTNALAKTDLWATGVRSLVPERVCLSPSPFHPIRLSRSRSDYHPNHAIPRGTAIISFPARSADWLVQSQPRSGEEHRGVATRSVLLALAPSTREEQRRAVERQGVEQSAAAVLCFDGGQQRVGGEGEEARKRERERRGGGCSRPTDRPSCFIHKKVLYYSL